MNYHPPICIFTYNRLNELTKSIEYLKENYLSSQTDLYIYSDGPKNNSDIEKVRRVRQYIKTIKGFKSINIIESDCNKGLATSIIEGVTEVIQVNKKIIVLEDDLITSKNFLDFMNQSLNFYEDDSRVLSVSGFTLALPSMPEKKDFYFGYRASSWGWATWKDKWEKVDWSVSDYDEFMKNRSLQKLFNRGGSDLTNMLRMQQKSKIDSWAIRFCYHQFKNDLLCVFPTVSKVQSIGFSKEATHTIGTRRFNTILDKSNQRDFCFEKFESMDDRLAYEFCRKFSITARALDKFRSVFNYK